MEVQGATRYVVPCFFVALSASSVRLQGRAEARPYRLIVAAAPSGRTSRAASFHSFLAINTPPRCGTGTFAR